MCARMEVNAGNSCSLPSHPGSSCIHSSSSDKGKGMNSHAGMGFDIDKHSFDWMAQWLLSADWWWRFVVAGMTLN